ncbi:MAG TPA: hypothetical protein VFN74_11730 [Chloroflexota bacterium]|nr:hypothetical protein [Chloroflexota bacterium]
MSESPRAQPITSNEMGISPPGTDRPSPAELRDPGAHDRGGWLTVDEAVQQFGIDRDLLQSALNEGRIAGRPVVEEGIAPENAPADRVVPRGQTAPNAPRDEWLVQREQVQKLLDETRSR